MLEFKHVIVTTIVGCLAVLGLLALALAMGQNAGFVFLPMIFFAGTLGASANNYRRLIKLYFSGGRPGEMLADPSENRQVAWLMTAQIYMSAVIGGLFAIILYVLFLSELVTGDLFPSFVDERSLLARLLDARKSSTVDLLQHVSLASPSDAAKAIVWAFIAGFSEQFVPNILDSLAQRAEIQAREPNVRESGDATEQNAQN